MQKALAEHLSVGDTYTCLTDSQSQGCLRAFKQIICSHVT